jgi:hypothetical protein
MSYISSGGQKGRHGQKWRQQLRITEHSKQNHYFQMEIESNCAFSEEFLAAFPSNRTYHNAFRASTPQKGLLWSLDEKEIIIEEIRESNQTVKKVAEYLGVKASRIYSILTVRKTRGSVYEPIGPSHMSFNLLWKLIRDVVNQD